MNFKKRKGKLNIKLIASLLVALVFIILFAFLIINASKREGAREMVVLEPVSQDMLYPEMERIRIMGTDVQITSDGIIFDLDGKKVLVKEDGSVWIINEDGSLERADSETTAKALSKAKMFANSNKEIRDMLDERRIDEKFDLSKLTDAQLRDLAKSLGYDPDSFVKTVREAQEKGEETTLAAIIDKDNEKKEAQKRAETMTKEALRQILEELGDTTDVESLFEAIMNDPDYRNNPKKIEEDILKYGIDYVKNKVGVGVGVESENEKRTDKDSDIQVAEKAERYATPTFTMDDYLTGKIDSLEGIVNPPSSYEKQNNQGGKANFLSSQRKETKVISRQARSNMLTSGTIINATLVTTINTDLPGQAVALVNQNVLDSFTMDNIVIPKGSRAIGRYDSSVSYGQNRVLIAWNEIVRPDGVIIQLNGYESVDSGGAGLTGNVNNHIGSIIGGTALSTLLSYANGSVADITNSKLLKALLTNTSDNVYSIEEKIIEKTIDRQPTITIKRGTNFSILVNDNVELPVYRRL